jgi:hypothetical protein
MKSRGSLGWEIDAPITRHLTPAVVDAVEPQPTQHVAQGVTGIESVSFGRMIMHHSVSSIETPTGHLPSWDTAWRSHLSNVASIDPKAEAILAGQRSFPFAGSIRIGGRGIPARQFLTAIATGLAVTDGAVRKAVTATGKIIFI